VISFCLSFFEEIRLAAGLYAVFRLYGSIAKFQVTLQEFMKNWLCEIKLSPR
jgi:DNA gyrase inhibitor GyrI